MTNEENPDEKAKEEKEAAERFRPKSYRYYVTKDGIRELLSKRIIDLVPTFKGLQRIRVIGRTEDGKVLSIDLGSEDGVTMGYSEQVWTLKDEDDPDLWSSRDMIRNIRFNIEPKEWKTDKKNVVKVNCFTSDEGMKKAIQDFLNSLAGGE